MGILEIHFHDSQFEWTFNPEATNTGSLPFGGSESAEAETAADGRGASAPSPAAKLRSLAILALVVAGAVAVNRIRSRRARKAREAREEESGGRLLSLSRSK